MANSILKNLVLQAAECAGLLNVLQNIGSGSHQAMYVLAYHRVAEFDESPWLSPALISATPGQFNEQMRFVAERYSPISIHSLLRACRGKDRLPKDAVLITVDDGYRDFQEHILPTCKRYGIQPLLFLPTAFVGAGNFWWDKVYQIVHFGGLSSLDTPAGDFSIATQSEKRSAVARLTQVLKSIPFESAMDWVDTTHSRFVKLSEEQQHNTLTWDELRQLVNDSVDVACHTHTHPIMTQIPLDQARQEVRLAQDLLRRELGNALPIFAFPDGRPHAFSNALFELLFSEGFEMLFLLTGGQACVQAGSPKSVMPRLSVWQSQTLAQFHMRLTPFWSMYESNSFRNSAWRKK